MSTRPPLFAPVFAQTTLPKPRLDYTKLLSDPLSTIENAQLRAFPLSGNHLSNLSSLRDTQRELLQKLNVTRARQKEVGNSIKKSKGPEAEKAKKQAKELKLLIKDYEVSLSTTESSLLDLALSLPNLSHPSTPIGPEENARTLETFGPTLIPSDPARDHVAFAQYFSLLDTSASAKTTGSSWPYLRGSLALLEQALISYTLSIATKHGFIPVIPPDVVKTDIAWRCGFQPRDQATNAAASQTYHLEPTSDSAPSLCLAGTSEIPLAGMFADMIIPEENLPQRVVGVGRAFRAEAGARGADTRGLYRVHQFTKVELFVVSSEEESESVMEEMRGVQKEIVQGLGLSVRCVSSLAFFFFQKSSKKVLLIISLGCWICRRKNSELVRIESMIWKHGCRVEENGARYDLPSKILSWRFFFLAKSSWVDHFHIQLHRLSISSTIHHLPPPTHITYPRH